MTNIASGTSPINGTSGADTLIAEEFTGASTADTIDANGGTGNVLFGDHARVFVDTVSGNSTIATATSIDAADHWSTESNPDVADDTIPYTSILATGANNLDFFSVTIGAGETATFDVDYGAGTRGGVSVDTRLTLFNSAGGIVGNNDDRANTFGGRGSEEAGGLDPFLTFLNTTGSTQTFFVRVAETSIATPNIPIGATYMLNVSVTGHATASTATFDDDFLQGSLGDDVIYGLDGDDTLIGTDGVDEVFGGNGNDTLVIDARGIDTGHLFSGAEFGGSSETDTIDASTFAGNLDVDLSSGTIDLVGGGAAGTVSAIDRVITGSGDDRIKILFSGVFSNSLFDGGAGTDTLDFSHRSTSYVLDLATGSFIESGLFIGQADNFENVFAGSGNDVITNASTVAGSTVDGGDGDDKIAISSTGILANETYQGGLGTDTLDLSATNIDYRVVLNTGAFNNTTGPQIEALAFGFENIIGGDGNDELTAQGNGSVNNIRGGEGDDTIFVGANLDTDDIFDGEGGTNTFSFDNLFADYTLDLVQETFVQVGSGRTGTVRNFTNINAGNGSDTLTGDNGDNTFNGGNGIDAINGGGGADTFFGGTGVDFLNGDDGNDTFFVVNNEIPDAIDGGADVDLLNLSSYALPIRVDLANEIYEVVGAPGFQNTILDVENVAGTNQDDTLIGDGEANELGGSGGVDTINGGGGNDRISGGNGEDILNGDAGDDFFFIAGTDQFDDIDGGADTDTVSLLNFNFRLVIDMPNNFYAVLGVPFTDKSIVSVENVEGTNQDDLIIGNGQDNNLFGSGGADQIRGGSGRDDIDGGTGADQMFGGAGDDVFFVDDLGDTVGENAGEGFDVVLSSVSFVLGANIELLQLTSGAGAIDGLGNGEMNTIIGNDQANGIAGGNANDILIGNGGDDALDGQNGADTMRGGTGSDGYNVDQAGDVIEEDFNGGEFDLVRTAITLTLPNNVEIGILKGGAANPIDITGNDGSTDDIKNLILGNDSVNTLTTFGGRDVILGRDGADTINAGGARDNIAGGGGADIITGGDGDDNFNYTDIGDAGDLITDFDITEIDVLDLRAMFDTFAGGGALDTSTAQAQGFLRLQDNGSSISVFADSDGTAGGNAEVLLALLNNVTDDLAAVDNFILV